LDELRASRQASKAKNAPKTATKRILVNELIVALQLRHPAKEWTSDSFAKEIGCTGAAVRATEAWKLYQKRQEQEKQKRPQREGFKDNDSGIEAFVADKKGNF